MSSSLATVSAVSLDAPSDRTIGGVVPSLSVIIPALNEEGGIADIIKRVKSAEEAVREAGGEGGLEIIVVDDGSTDRTVEIAASFPFVRVAKHEVNRGYGAAIKTGFRCARSEYLAFLDADGTYPPEHFGVLYRAAQEGGADLVVGSRRSGAESHMPLVRRLGNFIWSTLVTLLGNQRIADPASGMRVLRQTALPRLYPLPDGLNFTPVMSTRAVHEGLTITEVPIPYEERVGRSKLSVVRDGTRFLTTILWTALEYNPVRLLGIIGVGALGLAAAIGAVTVVARLQGTTQLGPWGVFGLFAALVLGVAGISIFSLGSTFNYLVSLFHRKPVHQGLFGKPIFNPPLDRQFGWLGVAAGLAGMTLAGASIVLGLSGWEITRLWFWLVVSALLSLIGLQLVLSWIVMRTLETLSERDSRVGMDMVGEVRSLGGDHVDGR